MGETLMCPLSTVNSGATVEVLSIHGGHGLVNRLARMGIYPGVTLQVLNNNRPGPVLIRLKETRIMLGFGMAHRIFVRPADIAKGL